MWCIDGEGHIDQNGAKPIVESPETLGIAEGTKKRQPTAENAKKNAQARNRTRGPTMATLDFTTKPLALACISVLFTRATNTEKIQSL